jgi:hypothetical protein
LKNVAACRKAAAFLFALLEAYTNERGRAELACPERVEGPALSIVEGNFLASKSRIRAGIASVFTGVYNWHSESAVGARSSVG